MLCYFFAIFEGEQEFVVYYRALLPHWVLPTLFLYSSGCGKSLFHQSTLIPNLGCLFEENPLKNIIVGPPWKEGEIRLEADKNFCMCVL